MLVVIAVPKGAIVKVFISWSGERSHKLAIVLRDWLPSVIQSVEPYVSSEDIDKGARWATDISKELEDAVFGILCVTLENRDASWLNFEAGALSKSVDRSKVAPFLVGIKRSEVEGPILQFQSTIGEREDVLKLLHSINNAVSPPPLEVPRLESVFDVWWPRLEASLDALSTEPLGTAPQAIRIDQQGAILEEMLELLRSQQRLLNSPAELLPSDYVQWILHQTTALGVEADHPALEELAHLWPEVEAAAAHIGNDDPHTAYLRDSVLRMSSLMAYILRTSGRRRPLRARSARGTVRDATA